jgi:hypothetical protein
MVGATGFEPATPCAQGRCATRLRYAPTPEDVDLTVFFNTIHRTYARAPSPRLSWIECETAHHRIECRRRADAAYDTPSATL